MRNYLTAWILAAALTIAAAITAIALLAASSVASGEGGHGACDDGVVDISAGTYDASPDIVVGVCIKAGNTQLHNLYTVDYVGECYDVEGIGTSTATVTRKGEGRTCQGISHIDVLTSTATPTPTPTPSATPTPTPSPIPTPTLTPIDPTPTPTSGTPQAFPNTGGEGSEPGGIDWLAVAMLLAGIASAAGGAVLLWSAIRRK